MLKLLTLALLAFAGNSAGAAECPAQALGLVKIRVNGELNVYATAKAKSACTACDQAVISIAAARIEAKALLASDTEVKKINDQLSGIVDHAVCFTEDIVFVTVLYSEANKNKAQQIKNEILRSLEASGSSMPLNPDNNQTSMDEEFQRLLGKPAETTSR